MTLKNKQILASIESEIKAKQKYWHFQNVDTFMTVDITLSILSWHVETIKVL